MKKFICVITVLTVINTYFSGLTAFAQPEPDFVPVAGGLNRRIEEVDPLYADIFQDSQMPVMSVMDSTEIQEPESEGNSCKFFNYGSDYGYNDIGTRPNGEECQRLYNKLKARCEAFKDYTQNLELTTLLVGGKKHYYYLLPHAAGDSEYIVCEALSKEDITDVYLAFRNDHPEYYWLSDMILQGTITFENYDKSYRILYPHIFDDCDYQYYSVRHDIDLAIDETVQEYIDAADAVSVTSEYRIAKQVHDDMCANMTYGYDEDGYVLDIGYAHNIAGALDGDDETQPVCEGYAKAYQLILNALGLKVLYVTGYIVDEEDPEGPKGHAWDMVKLDDGKYYWVDVSWDDIWSEAALDAGYETYDDEYDYYAHLFFAKGNENDEFWYDSSNAHILDEDTETWYIYALPTSPDDDFDENNTRTDMIVVKNARVENGVYSCDLCFGEESWLQPLSIITAFYDEHGRMVHINFEDMPHMPTTKIHYTSGEPVTDYASYKFMIWESLYTMVSYTIGERYDDYPYFRYTVVD